MSIENGAYDWELNSEKKVLKEFLESRILKLDNEKTIDDLQWLINEINTAKSSAELDDVVSKLEQLRDWEIDSFLKTHQRSALKNLRADVSQNKDVYNMDERTLKKVADRWRKYSAETVKWDLAEIKKSLWNWFLATIIDKAG